MTIDVRSAASGPELVVEPDALAAPARSVTPRTGWHEPPASAATQSPAAPKPSAEPARDADDSAPEAAPRSTPESMPAGPPAVELDRVALLPSRPAVPARGWRRAVHTSSRGRITPKPTAAELERDALRERATASLAGGTRFVAVLARKGGVGKTTTAVLLGQTLAALRTDRVLAIDANPDRGTLADRVTGPVPATVRTVIAQAPAVQTFTELSTLVARDPSRLDVIASDTDPELSVEFDDTGYRAVADLAERHYGLVVTDCGTGMVHPAQQAALFAAHGLVLVAGTAVDEALLAAETLTWLNAHGHSELAQDAVVVINHSTAATPAALASLDVHFANRCRAVVHLPHDPHLAEGAAIDPSRLHRRTRLAALALAAHVLDGLTIRTPPAATPSPARGDKS